MKKFELGRLVMTSGVSNKVEEEELFAKFVASSLYRHANCDWGDMCHEDKKANNLALEDGSRLFSAYTDYNFPKIWIITEADRAATTILFPDEY